MRGEYCIGAASFFSLAATILLVFAHIGQTNHTSIARGISLISVNVSGLGNALSTATGDATPGFYYYNNVSYAPLGQGFGLRQVYEWGFYGYCGYLNKESGEGLCSAESNATFGYAFTPFNALLDDSAPQYRTITSYLIPQSAFKDTSYETTTSRAGFYIIFIGSLAAALALILGLIRHNTTFTLAFGLSIFSALMLLIGAAIWTALIKKTQSINDRTVVNVPLGLKVSFGIALWLIWGAFFAILLSIVPYFLSWWTYRRRYV